MCVVQIVVFPWHLVVRWGRGRHRPQCSRIELWCCCTSCSLKPAPPCVTHQVYAPSAERSQGGTFFPWCLARPPRTLAMSRMCCISTGKRWSLFPMVVVGKASVAVGDVAADEGVSISGLGAQTSNCRTILWIVGEDLPQDENVMRPFAPDPYPITQGMATALKTEVCNTFAVVYVAHAFPLGIGADHGWTWLYEPQVAYQLLADQDELLTSTDMFWIAIVRPYGGGHGCHHATFPKLTLLPSKPRC